MTDAFDRGHVVWHPSLFKDGGRPYLVLSDASHPFHGEEYIIAGVTTTEREGRCSDKDYRRNRVFLRRVSRKSHSMSGYYNG